MTLWPAIARAFFFPPPGWLHEAFNPSPRSLMKKHVKNKFSAAISGKPVFKFAAEGDSAPSLAYLPVLPVSPFNTQDARSGITYVYDLGVFKSTSFKNGRKRPLDIEHNTEGAGSDTRARGWFSELVTAEDVPDAGLEPGFCYAMVELNALGQSEVGGQLYGYTSAVAMGMWLDENTVQFTRLKSLALTNNPACDMPMAFTAEDEADEDESASQGTALDAATTADDAMLKAILTKLGLAEDADQAAIEAAIDSLSKTATDATAAQQEAAAQFTSVQTESVSLKSQVATLTTQVTSLTAELTTAKADLQAAKTAESERVVLGAVDAAIASRKATPATRDSLLSFARADLAAFNAWAAAAPDVLDPTGAPAPRADGFVDTHGLTAEQQADAKTKGVTFQRYAEIVEQARQQLGL
jgi:hypothetical protein